MIIPSSDAYENKNGGKKFEGGYSSSILTPALKRNARLKQTLLTRVPNNENVSSRYLQVAEKISMNGRNSSMTQSPHYVPSKYDAATPKLIRNNVKSYAKTPKPEIASPKSVNEIKDTGNIAELRGVFQSGNSSNVNNHANLDWMMALRSRNR